jgi:DNA-directed RNA polymerase beta subunit
MGKTTPKIEYELPTWDILDAFFMQSGDTDCANNIVRHQIESFNEFIDKQLIQIIQGFNPIQVCHNYNPDVGNFKYKIYLNILRPSLTKPMYQTTDGTQMLMTPHLARINNLTYSSNLYVDIHVITDIINDDHVIERKENTISHVCIGKIPIMVRSKGCVLSQVPGIAEGNGNHECRYDYGGYFIVNGNEKVVISQDRISENKTLVFAPNGNGDGLYAEIRSMPDGMFLPPKTTSLHLSGKSNHMGNIIRLSASFLRAEVPLFVMFRALGIESDKEIYAHIVLDLDDAKQQRVITQLAACAEDACDVHTQADALTVLLKILGTTGTPKEFLDQQKRAFDIIKNTIKNDFLSHTGHSFKKKALYLGYMVRKLLSIHLGYLDFDNRDSYLHKRIDTPGILFSNLFRQCYGKLIKEVRNLIVRELNLWRASTNMPFQIINQNNVHRFFKHSLIETGLRYALSTGNWGVKSIGSFQNIRQGVAQVLNRMSYLSTLSHMRRINTPMEKNGKLVQPRKLENSQYGMICPSECFDPETPILLWNGNTVKAQDIIVGDYLIDDNGNSIKVKSTCSGYKTMYDIIPTKKNFMSYTVTDNHILTLKVKKYKSVRNHRGKREFMWFDKKTLSYNYKDFKDDAELQVFESSLDNDDVIDITIEKYLSLPNNVQKNLYTFKSSGIHWESKEVALDPYILGMWLGDGLSCGYGFVTADKELLDKWNEWGVDNDATVKKGLKYKYHISSTINNTQSGIACNKTEKAPLKKLLTKYNLVKNKHIPLDYLVNDRKTRLAVLAGLIDTDGSVRANGHEIRITQGEPNYQIIYDTEFLARSLGFSCHVNEGICSYTVNGEKRQKPYKELSITGQYLYEIPTVLPRKKLNKFDNPISEKRGSSFLQSSFTLVQKDVQPFVGWQVEGSGRFLLADMSVVHNTPEGAAVGLVKNIALSTHITVNVSSVFVRETLKELGTELYGDHVTNSIEFLKRMGSINSVHIMINGDIIGFHTEPEKLYTQLKHLKRYGSIPPTTAIVWDVQKNLISLSTEAGRMLRPLYIVDGPTESTNSLPQVRLFNYLSKNNKTWKAFYKDFKSFQSFVAPMVDEITEGFIEYMDVDEIDKAMVAMIPQHLKRTIKGTTLPPKFTHCEIEPSLLNGVLAANIPFMDHNQAPRNCYQSAMGKQAVGVYMTNFNHRIDTLAHVLHYPQKPLVRTKLAKYTNSMALPSGINAVVAIMTHTGFNQEDSVMLNKSAVDRGLFTSTYFKSYRDQCSKNHSTGEEEIFTKPVVEVSASGKMKPFNYDKLDENGFIPKNVYVDSHDILVGKVMPQKIQGVITERDTSLQVKGNDDGHIDLNYQGINGDGYKFCKIRLRKYRKPQIGDKLASRSAQKGTIGMVYNHQDMPFTKDGISPDIIMNPHAIPSRMTIGQLMECIMGKACCHIGSIGDSTPFTDCSVDSIANILEKSGYEKYGNEILYNGRTGEQMKTEIFIGPTYYQRLKHMVADKSHCLTMDHEVLTENGWKFFPDITKEDLIATLKDGKLIYDKLIDLLYFPEYEGKMYHISNQAIDLDVTANHRMWVSKCQTRKRIWSEYQMEKAEDIIGKMIRYKKDAVWEKLDYQFILPKFGTGKRHTPDKIVNMNAWLTFFGIWIAEGWTTTYTTGTKLTERVQICDCKQRVKDALYPALEKLGYNYDDYADKTTITNKQLYNYMKTYSVGAPNKYLPEWVWELSSNQCKLLMESMILGDGSYKPNGCLVYYTSSIKLADDVMRLCLHAGWTSMKHLHSKAGNTTVIKGRQIVSQYDMWRLSVIKKRVNPTVNHGHTHEQIIQKEFMYDFKGPVFCLQVSSEVFMVRKNGKSVWTGNSRGSNGPIVLLTRQPAEGRARNGGLRFGEMERDAIVAHGAAAFLKERMLDVSDNFRVFICRQCGLICTANPEKSIYKCSTCKNNADVSQVRIPYAMKLLIQELMSMGVSPRITV